MILEILSIPADAHAWAEDLVIGQRYALYKEACGEFDFYWFRHGPRDLPSCLEDLVLNNVEFKVIHEEA